MNIYLPRLGKAAVKLEHFPTKIIAWSWAWDKFSIDIINALPDNVIVMSKSEAGIPFCIGGIEGKVGDYSMSIVGPVRLRRKTTHAGYIIVVLNLDQQIRQEKKL